MAPVLNPHSIAILINVFASGGTLAASAMFSWSISTLSAPATGVSVKTGLT
jgi:hypothetical protein